MANNKKLQVVLIAVLVLMTIGVIYVGYWGVGPTGSGGRGGGGGAGDGDLGGPTVSPRTDGKVDPNRGEVIAGGVERPATDLAPRAPDGPGPGGSALGVVGDGKDPLDYGLTPGVPVDATEQTLAAAEAVEMGAFPERLSVLSASDHGGGGFDAQRYREDTEYRSAYLRVPGPSRVFAPAQPGEGVESVQVLGPLYQQIEQGESVTLRVALGPDGVQMPVTFTSFDLGVFDASQMTTVTVEADDRGVAQASFTAPPGTIEDVRIMAASPVTTGQVRFVVNVQRPSGEDDPGS